MMAPPTGPARVTDSPAAKPKPKLRRRWRILIGAAACMAILFAATLVWLAWDEAEPDLSDVLPRARVDLQAQANWAQLLSACRAMGDASQTWEPPETLAEAAEAASRAEWQRTGKFLEPLDVFFLQDRPREELGALVAALEKTLPPLDAALAAADFEFPLPENFDQSADLSPRDAVWALQTLGRFYLKFGDPEAALEMVRRQFRLADCVEMAEGDWDTALLGRGVRGIGLKTLDHCMEALQPSGDRFASMLSLSEEARPSVAPYAESLRVELFRTLLLFEEVRHGQVKDRGQLREVDLFGPASLTRLFIRPNETRRMLGELVRLSIRQIEQPKRQGPSEWELRFPLHFRVNDRFHLPRPDNFAGRYFAHTLSAPFSISGVQTREQTAISAKQAAWAARAYQRDHQKLPPDLNALVPDYLPGVPRDHLLAEPISYDAELGVVWSPATVEGKRPARYGRDLENGIIEWLLPEPEPPEDEASAWSSDGGPASRS